MLDSVHGWINSILAGQPIHKPELSVITALMIIASIIKCRMKLLLCFQNSTVDALKFQNGLVFFSNYTKLFGSRNWWLPGYNEIILISLQITNGYHWRRSLLAHWVHYLEYRQNYNISRTLVGGTIVDHSGVVGALPVGADPTASSFSISRLASMDWTETAARRDEKYLNFGIWCAFY